MVQGYPIVGEVEPSGVFRPILGKEALPLDSWLGDSAEHAIGRIEQSRPPRFADRIFQATVDEQKKGFCSEFLDRQDLDARFGKGQWRPLERFLIVQPDGKERVIDNAKRTLHNSSTSMVETIYTVNLDFIPAVVKQLAQRLQVSCPEDWSVYHPWVHFRLGTEDLPDACLPVQQDHLPFSAVAIWVPQQGWRYTILWGLAFGLESAVVSFNRLPQLGVAAARRCLYAVTAAYFDDELAVEVVAQSNVSQLGLKLAFEAMGAPPQKSKSFAPTPDRHYLGAAIHLGSVANEGFVRIQPKFSTSAKVASRLRTILQNRSLTQDDAGKLRGDLTWMFSLSAGHLGRLAQPVLAKCSANEITPLEDDDVVSLRVLLHIVLDCQPRGIQVCGSDRAPLLIYSDASFEDGILRLGWVVLSLGTNTRPQGGTCVVPPEVLATWLPRKQQIYPGEAVVALVLPVLLPEVLAARGILWFIDNESAVSTLVRCASSQCDVHEIAQYSHYLLHMLRSRVWYEWIDSDSNPSDGLSRLGLEDEWTQSQNWDLKAFPFPPGLSRGEFLQSLSELQKCCGNEKGEICIDAPRDEAQTFILHSLHRRYPTIITEECLESWAGCNAELWLTELKCPRYTSIFKSLGK
eukprot:s83_g10.t1